MTSGLPDYFRSIRPRYGAAKHKGGAKIATASDETELCSVSGKGMIYGGVIWLDVASTQRNSVVYLYIDDEKFHQPTIYNLYEWRFTSPHTTPWCLLNYDNTLFLYSLKLSPGYTFESSFKFSYLEQHGDTILVFYRVFYALI